MNIDKVKEIAERIRDSKKHTLLMTRPGCGATMIAHRVACPCYEHSEDHHHIVPFRAPHHSCSDAALRGREETRIGNITMVAGRPGEIALASGGVLYLDDINEFSRECIETVRSAMLFQGNLTDARKMIVVASTYPCPCGWYGARSEVAPKCKCSNERVDLWAKRIQPLRDLMQVVTLY